jgi:hypothetical protein
MPIKFVALDERDRMKGPFFPFTGQWMGSGSDRTD